MGAEAASVHGIGDVPARYWRKHPNLHGYIVQSFADGVDECQEIGLSEGDLVAIIEAVKAGELPHTVGFFFGASQGTAEEIEEDLRILGRAVEWLRAADDPNVQRWVTYRASW